MHKTTKLRSNPEVYQGAANTLSVARGAGGFALAAYVVARPEAHSLVLAGEVMALGVSDKVDGWLGKFAARLRGYKSLAGQRIDERMDKFAVHSLMLGFTAQAAINGNTLLAGSLLAGQATITMRDRLVGNQRNIAAPLGIDVGARWYNKAKTTAQFAVMSAVASPLNTPENSALLTAGVAGTAVASIAGGAVFVSDLRRQEAAMSPHSDAFVLNTPNNEAA